jgi:valyl-tRNA synthetase
MALNEEISSIEVIGLSSFLLEGCESEVKETLKAKELVISSKGEIEEKIVSLKPLPAKIGPAFKAKASEVSNKIRSANPQEFLVCPADGKYQLQLEDGSVVEIHADCFEVQKQLTLHGKSVETVQVGDLLVAIQK